MNIENIDFRDGSRTRGNVGNSQASHRYVLVYEVVRDGNGNVVAVGDVKTYGENPGQTSYNNSNYHHEAFASQVQMESRMDTLGFVYE